MLGAGENRGIDDDWTLLLLCVCILLLPILLALLLLLFLVDFSQKNWYHQGMVGGEQDLPKIDFIFLGKYIIKNLTKIIWLIHIVVLWYITWTSGL